jgi:SAM-dependent methyltransferase
MNCMTHINKIEKIMDQPLQFNSDNNFIALSQSSIFLKQNNTNSAFSYKWSNYNSSDEKEKCFEMQKKWYLDLYGFSSEQEFANFLNDREIIYDAGCGIGYKAAWFAELSPNSTVIGMDFSDAATFAAENYKHIPNLYFIQGDISKATFKESSIDYVSCDQVIMHTEVPEKTFAELSRITKADGQFACYFYAKKALPRELLDDFFRTQCDNMSHEELMEMSSQLTELGKRLSDLNITFDAPAIPALGIKGGEINLQRFIYWNFLKCFWNPDLGPHTSTMTNFDWYSPSNAKRFSQQEVESLLAENNMGIKTLHSEEACYSGRFVKL